MAKKNRNDQTENIEENIPETGSAEAESADTECGASEEATAESGNTQDAQSDADSLSDALQAEKDKYMRLYAEYDNFRKRSQKEREALFTAVRAETVLQFLPVYDNLQRALGMKSSDEAFCKGIEMTMVQLQDILGKLGVTPIEAVGNKFDANLHNAVMHIDDETKGENEIVEEFQKGFMLGDKVIRFSVVKVAN